MISPVVAPEQVRAFFNSHWTVRKYKSFVIPDDHLSTMMDAAQRASTNASAQLYSIIRLKSPELRKQIAQLSNNPHIATASEAFIVCADFHRVSLILKQNNVEMIKAPTLMHHFGVGDAVMAGEHLLLAAEMLGYRGCWIGGVLNSLEDIMRLLKLPAHVLPFAGLTIGVPDEEPVHRPRVSRDLIFHTDTYREPRTQELKEAVHVMSEGRAEGAWAELLKRYFGPGGTAEGREPHLSAKRESQFGQGQESRS